MTPVTGTLRELFEAAVALDPAQRRQFLADRCMDAEQRAALERMLTLDENPAQGVLEQPLDALLDSVGRVEPAPGLPSGATVGPFRVLERLGEGGSSIVYRAEREQDGVGQVVALKLLRRGLYGDHERRRFRAERRALAELRHPDIARLIEGGVTADGAAYIALEFVDGVPITAYAREHRLDLRARLRLVVAVCRAVEAAHRALIVHRDLKPSNVLVTPEGEVKLLDFGIAKWLDEDLDDTRTQQVAMTPAYAAPEQREHRPVTTATDVYALGVLLGELVAGVRRAAGDERALSTRVGAEHEPGALPAPPAQTRRLLRGDLDNIALKATATEPERRYASAGALADDIERFLHGKPVAAHPPSAWYRTRKFVARHKGGVLTTGLFLLAILAALGTATWQARIARREAVRANVVRDFLISIFRSAGADLPKDKRPSTADLVDQAAKRLAAGGGLPPATRADLLVALAKVSASVGDYDRAIALLDESRPLLGALYAAHDAPALDADVTRASALAGKSDSAGVIALLAPQQSALLARHDGIGFAGLDLLGEALVNSGHTDAGLRLLAQTREAAQREAAHQPEAALEAMIAEAGALIDARQFKAGLDRAQAAAAFWHRQGEPVDPHMAELYGGIAKAAEATGDIARAEAAYQQAIALDARFFDKPNPQGAWDTGIYGTFLVAQGRYAEAEPYVRKGLEQRRQVFGDDNPATLFGYAGMGKLYTGEHRFDEAERWYGEGVDSCHAHALANTACAQLLSLRGYVRGMQQHYPGAEQDLHEALGMQEKIGGAVTPAYAYVLRALTTLQVQEGKFQDAVATADRALAISGAVKGDMIQSELDLRYWRARALFGLERNDDALQEILAIEPKYSALFPDGASRFRMLRLEAVVLAAAGRRDQAAKAAQQALDVETGHPQQIDPSILAELRRLAAHP